MGLIHFRYKKNKKKVSNYLHEAGFEPTNALHNRAVCTLWQYSLDLLDIRVMRYDSGRHPASFYLFFCFFCARWLVYAV